MDTWYFCNERYCERLKEEREALEEEVKNLEAQIENLKAEAEIKIERIQEIDETLEWRQTSPADIYLSFFRY